jgi:hypothetical protein
MASETIQYAAEIEPQEGDPALWLGRYEARVRCPHHPHAPCRVAGDAARCSECGEAIDLCTADIGSKRCALARGHVGSHCSASGTSWPAAADDIPPRDSPEEYLGIIRSLSEQVRAREREAAQLRAEIAERTRERDALRDDLAALARGRTDARTEAASDVASRLRAYREDAGAKQALAAEMLRRAVAAEDAAEIAEGDLLDLRHRLRRMHRRAQAAERALRVALNVGRDECRRREDWVASMGREIRHHRRMRASAWDEATDLRDERDEARALLALALEHGGAECDRLRNEIAGWKDSEGECRSRWLSRDRAADAAEGALGELRAKVRALLGALPTCAECEREHAMVAIGSFGQRVLGDACAVRARERGATVRDLPHAAALRALVAALGDAG